MVAVSAEVIPYALPFHAPYVTARGSLDRREMLLLRVRDPDGRVGLGEAVPLSLRGGPDLATVGSELRAWAAEPIFPGPLEDFGFSAPALCAIRTAELDLASRSAGVPAWHELTFGAGSGDPVPCNATLVAGGPGAVAEDALRWAGWGFSTFKLKLGTGDDAEVVGAVREALGPEARIRADANEAWDLPTARRVLASIEDMDIELVEQPVAGLARMAELKEETEILLAADESVTSPLEAQEAFQADACDLISVKLPKVGQVDLSHFRDTFPIYLSSALDGPVGIAAAAHATQALMAEELDAGIAHGLATQLLFSETIAEVGCELKGDMLRLPEGPGLGVVIDEAALERHRI